MAPRKSAPKPVNLRFHELDLGDMVALLAGRTNVSGVLRTERLLLEAWHTNREHLVEWFPSQAARLLQRYEGEWREG